VTYGSEEHAAQAKEAFDGALAKGARRARCTSVWNGTLMSASSHEQGKNSRSNLTTAWPGTRNEACQLPERFLLGWKLSELFLALKHDVSRIANLSSSLFLEAPPPLVARLVHVRMRLRVKLAQGKFGASDRANEVEVEHAVRLEVDVEGGEEKHRGSPEVRPRRPTILTRSSRRLWPLLRRRPRPRLCR
jgi:hypothetical protein